jgi:hypothetical protein
VHVAVGTLEGEGGRGIRVVVQSRGRWRHEDVSEFIDLLPVVR